MDNTLKLINKKILIVVIGAVVSGIFLTIAIYKLKNTANRIYASIKINNLLTECRKQEESFLAQKKIKFIDEFQKTSKELIREVDNILINNTLPDRKINVLSEIIHEYRNNFILLSNDLITLGLSNNDELKKSFEKVEKTLIRTDQKTLHTILLKCVIIEKDYFITEKTQLIKMFHKCLEHFVNDLNKSNLQKDLKKQILNDLNKYKLEFIKIHNSVPIAGVGIKKTAMEDMLSSRGKIETYLKKLGLSIRGNVERSLQILFVGVFLLLTTMFLGTILIFELLKNRKILNHTINKKELVEKELVEHKTNLEGLVNDRTKELQGALDRVNQLSGLLPICAACKKIRDDKGYWNQIESYLSINSEAEFSHSICPECTEKLYPEFYEDIIKDSDNEKNDEDEE